MNVNDYQRLSPPKNWHLMARLAIASPERDRFELDLLLRRNCQASEPWAGYAARAVARDGSVELFSVLGLADEAHKELLVADVRDEAIRRIEEADWRPNVIYGRLAASGGPDETDVSYAADGAPMARVEAHSGG